MGKHNGKARKVGLSVGKTLVNKAKKDGRTGSAAAYIHTTDIPSSTNMQSIIESNDLQEMMSLVRHEHTPQKAYHSTILPPSTHLSTIIYNRPNSPTEISPLSEERPSSSAQAHQPPKTQNEMRQNAAMQNLVIVIDCASPDVPSGMLAPLPTS